MLRSATLTFALALLAVGCASAEGAYKDGMELETAGRYEEAARAYATALQRDADLPNVRGRLDVAGREAVARRIAAAEGSADAVAAADAYLAAEAIVRQAGVVGVDLARPASFEDDLAAARSAAVEALLSRGAAAAGRGAHAEALRHLDAARPYGPDADQRSALDATARDVYGDWADADVAAGRYGAAYEHAEAALGLADPGSDAALALADLRADILDAGTVVAAVFPAEPASARADLPRGLLRDLDDVLQDDVLADLPPLLALVPSSDVRRQLRGARDADDRAESPRVLAGLARDLRADIGIAVEMGDLAETETERRRETKSARRRRGGGAATYTRVSRDLGLTARGRIVAVDAESRLEVCDSEAPATVTERYDVALFDGDPDDLGLSRSERALFGADAVETARDRALDALRDRLAESLAERIVGCLRQHVR